MNKFNVDDFPDNYKDIVEIVGVDNAISISKRMGGTSQYIPKLDDIHRRVRNNKIRNEFNGNNISTLSRKYGLTEMQIRNILQVRVASIEDFLE